MSVRLTITQRDQPGTAQEPRKESFELDTIQLGRDPSCDVVLPLKAVSRSHARIVRDGGICYIEDAGSSYGTQVNHEPLPQGEKRRLYNGDVIAIAQFDLLFETIVQFPSGTYRWQDIKSSNKQLSILASEKPYLRIMNGPNEGMRIELDEGHEYIVGRTKEAQILLNTDLVSRMHAKLRRDFGGTHVEDLGSRNGIRLNRKQIASATLSDGDELEIGGIKMLYIDLNEMKDSPLSFDKPDNKAPAQQQAPAQNTSAAQPPPPPPPPQKPPPPPAEQKKPEPEKREPEKEKRKPDKAPEEKPAEEKPAEEAPEGEASSAEGSSLEAELEKPKKPLHPALAFLQRHQTLVVLGIGGGTALIALIFLILVLAGA
jgi:pSer/pThr/pTyr-binding forkhead associated (FHA) protein